MGEYPTYIEALFNAQKSIERANSTKYECQKKLSEILGNHFIIEAVEVA